MKQLNKYNIISHSDNTSISDLTEMVDGVLYKEEWRDIEGYLGQYQISNFGRVKSIRYKRSEGKVAILKPTKIKAGYFRVDLKVKKNHKFIHILVARAFIPNTENKPEVNHKEGVKVDNRAWELEWATKSEQQIHAQDKLGFVPNTSGLFAKIEQQKRPIKQIDAKTNEVIQIFSSQQDACRYFGLDKDAIYRVLKLNQKTAAGFKWEYV